jgi:hypothetical protein
VEGGLSVIAWRLTGLAMPVAVSLGGEWHNIGTIAGRAITVT